MSPLLGISQAGQSLQSVWDRVANKTDELGAQLANGDIDAGSFVKTVVELKALKLQADAAGVVFKTLNDMAGELLSSPRK